MDFQFGDMSALNLLWLLPLVGALFAWAWRARRRALARLADSALIRRISAELLRRRRLLRHGLVLAALLLLIVGLARPQWNPRPAKTTVSGRDVVFLLDCSRSMLAEDVSPDRLARAKLMISDVVDKLKGERVALVAFAGKPVIKCPLTLDYEFFRMVLQDAGPDDVPMGGTAIGDAIRVSVRELLKGGMPGYMDMIMITDGEDHGSFPTEAAREAAQNGIDLILVGVGDAKEGARIPVPDADGNVRFLKYKGREVWSRLEGDQLKKMVEGVPNAQYIPVGTSAVDLDEIYAHHLAQARKRRLTTTTRLRYEEKFQIFLALSFTLLCVEMLIRESKQ